MWLDKFHCNIFKYVLTVLKYLKKPLIAYRVRHLPATINGRVRMMWYAQVDAIREAIW